MKSGKHLAATALGAALLGAFALPAAADVLYFDFNANLVPPTASLFLFGTAGQAATVSNLAGFNQSVTLNSSGFFSLAIPAIYQQSGTSVLNTGFRVDSGAALAGYFINRGAASTDMSYLLNGAALDKNYVVASFGNGFGEGSQVAIHATVDNTHVTFTPKGGAAINVTLNSGQTYKYAGGAVDLTGSFISSDQNVAVFSGNNCTNVPNSVTACDTLLEQAIPTSKLSKTYVTTATAGAVNSSLGADLLRVIATVDGTQVKRDGVVVATLAAGAFYEFQLPKNSGTKIDASQPVALAQYLTGAGSGGLTDPALSYVPGADTLLNSYKLATPSGASAFSTNYASVVVDANDLTTLMLNGVLVNTSSFYAIGTTGFYGGSIDLNTVPLGVFTLTAADPFLVLLGGGSSFDSYLTYGGSSFAPGVSPVDPVTPGVPEPSVLALFGIALAGLGLSRRAKRKNV